MKKNKIKKKQKPLKNKIPEYVFKVTVCDEHINHQKEN